jgi:hypothetical protein
LLVLLVAAGCGKGDGDDAQEDSATASGLVVASEVDTAKPVGGVTVLDFDQRGPVEVIVDDGAMAHTYAFQRCELQPVIGPDDRQYLFDLSFVRPGSGVQCRDIDSDGRRDLLGVFFEDNRDSTATVKQTVLELEGITARNGDVSERTVRIEAGNAAGHRRTLGDHRRPAGRRSGAQRPGRRRHRSQRPGERRSGARRSDDQRERPGRGRRRGQPPVP